MIVFWSKPKLTMSGLRNIAQYAVRQREKFVVYKLMRISIATEATPATPFDL